MHYYPSRINREGIMSAFSETFFIQHAALHHARRLGLSVEDLAALPDGHEIEVNTSPARYTWPVAREAMTSESWIIARMAADIRELLAPLMLDASKAGEAVVTETDLAELGWSRHHVRAFSSVSLALAHGSLQHEANTAHQRGFSGFAGEAATLALAAAASLSVFAIGLWSAGVGSLA